MLNMIEGWKGITNFFESKGIRKHPRTLKTWHYKILKIPFDRVGHQSFVIPEVLLVRWYLEVIDKRKNNPPYHRHI